VNFTVKTVIVLGAIGLSACNPSTNIDVFPKIGAEKSNGQELEGAPEHSSAYRASINANKPNLSSITSVEVPSLNDLIKIEADEPELPEDPTDEDKLRLPAMRDTAMTFGARGGLSFTSRQINMMLQQRAQKLDRIYDFSNLVIRGPDNVVVLPPVISEAKKSYEMSDQGKMVRVADEIFEIISQAQFAPGAPLWHSYLIREYSPPKDPPSEILPRTPQERKYWERHVREGWEAGVKQANDIFQLDLNRLDRDYNGMVRYKGMLTEGKVSAPVLAKAPMGVTGDGSDMRVNDRAIRIMKDPSLQTDPSKWTPTIGNGPAVDYAVPNGSTSARDFPTPGNRRY